MEKKSFKIILIGDRCIGKKSFLLSFINDEYTIDNNIIIGVDFKKKEILINNELIELKIWEIEGGERFKPIIQSYCKNSNGFLLTYSITQRSTFENLKSWINFLNLNTEFTILIGLNSDLESEREVSFEEGYNFFKFNNLLDFFEISSKEFKNIQIPFINLIKKILIEEEKKKNNNLQEIKKCKIL